MPRASGSAKRHTGAANQRDTRHENGLVGPGRRVASKRSQGQLEAATRPGEQTACSSLPSPPPHGTNGSAKGHGDLGRENGSAESLRRGSLDGYSESSSSESIHLGNGVIEATHRQIDVNAAKNTDVHRDSGPVELAATVLKALPLYDTLAILIVLMQLPPISLSGIYILFTFLTFVPPVTTTSGMNINFAELFDWNATMPSLVTVLCMDFFILLIWLFLWPPAQHWVLDCAKAVIAGTLGGGTSRDGASSRSVLTCFLVVAASHLLKGARWYRAMRMLPPQFRLTADHDDPLESVSSSYDKGGLPRWIKSVLAIHILTQGLVRYIREWYIRREKGNSTSQGSLDPEAGKAAPFSADSTDGGFVTPDTDASVQPSAASTTKKKRKQSTQVRLQQPLWAALASTKIVMVKEYELSQAASESAGTNATDIHDLGNAPFDGQPGQIWISYIGCDEVCFSTSHFPDQEFADSQHRQQNGHAARPAGLDTSKPFYVRVNNANWQLTRIHRVEDDGDDGQQGARWTGDIYGLRPMSKFVCEFVDTQTDAVIFSTSIRTPRAPTKELDSTSGSSPNGQRSMRPASPATTLKTSIAAAEAKLAEERAKLKTGRKDWKSKINSLKKDNDRLDNAVLSGGSNDDKLRQKIQQHETQKAQAEKDISQLGTKIEDFDVVPEEVTELKKDTEKAWTAEKAEFDAAQKAFNRHKASLDGVVKSKGDEQQTLQTKRNKVATRIAKVDGDLARIADANNRGLNEAERRRQERQAWEAEVANVEMNLTERLNTVRAANTVKQEQIKSAIQQLAAGHEQMSNYANGAPFDSHHAPPQQFSNPLNPWAPNPAVQSHHPASSMWPSGATIPAPSSVPPPTSAAQAGPTSTATAWSPPPHPTLSAVGAKARGRSSSMLSDMSGFTQSSAADDDALTATAPHSNPLRGPSGLAFQRQRQRSDGGSGSRRSSLRSGSGSAGSARDPTSPV